jgi:hypothetical protein
MCKDLPPYQRHITTHDANGRSIYKKSVPQPGWDFPGVGNVSRSYAVPAIPAILNGEVDVAAYQSEESPTYMHKRDITIQPRGANLTVVTLAPGGSSGMHQTCSIDFSICVSGSIKHELDGGEVVTLKPGVSNSLAVCLDDFESLLY